MDPGPESDYEVVRHASIAGKPGPAAEGLAWVVIAHWRWEDGSEEWFTEYWDHRFNEESGEQRHASEADAVEHAEGLFGRLDWESGMPLR